MWCLQSLQSWEFSQWVPWKAEKCETPDWWSKLLAVPGMEDYRKLAREVWASFWLPQWMQELGMKEANLQAPPAPPCLGRHRFMLLAILIYACRDIQEIPQEKVVAYARALQHWVEEINPPAGGGEYLLAEGIKELREEVKWYLSFSNEEVFQGVALPEREEDQKLKTLYAGTPNIPEPTKERRGLNLLGWKKVLHPSQPVMATGEIPQSSKTSKPKAGPIQLPQILSVKPPASLPKASTPPKPSLPVQALALVQPPTLPCSFMGVMASLWTPELVEVAL